MDWMYPAFALIVVVVLSYRIGYAFAVWDIEDAEMNQDE